MTDWVQAKVKKKRERQKKEREMRLPETEWAGMTDWVKAVVGKPRNQEERSENGCKEARDRVGRNDRLSQGCERKWRWWREDEPGAGSQRPSGPEWPTESRQQGRREVRGGRRRRRTVRAGMTDWVPAVEEREGGKGEKTGEGKEVRQGKAANNRVGRNDRLGWGWEEESTLRERTRREAKKELRTEWAGMTDWVQAGSVEEKVSVERKSGD